jgi:hypothetical protein
LPANIKLGCKWLTAEKSCLLPYRINYDRKNFYSTGPWTDSFVLIREKKYEKFCRFQKTDHLFWTQLQLQLIGLEGVSKHLTKEQLAL